MNKYFDYLTRLFRSSDSIPGEDGSSETASPRQSRNVTAKILAVFIAVGLWLYVMNEQNPPIEARYTVPLEVRNVQANYVVADYPSEIRVRVRGPRALIAGTTRKDIAAYVDMTNLSEGRHNVAIHSLIPPSLELVEHSPENVIVRLEPIITRTVPVMVEFRGALPKTAVISQVNTKLAEATVKGPKHIVDTVEKLLGTIDISGKTASFNEDVPLAPLGRSGVLVEGVTVAPPVTPVQVNIEPSVVKVTLAVKPIFHGELPPGITLRSITFDPAHIEISDPSGAGKLIEKLEYIYTEPINLAEITHDTNKVVKIAVPEGLKSAHSSVVAHIKAGK